MLNTFTKNSTGNIAQTKHSTITNILTARVGRVSKTGWKMDSSLLPQVDHSTWPASTSKETRGVVVSMVKSIRKIQMAYGHDRLEEKGCHYL